jgi:hypothetical protein
VPDTTEKPESFNFTKYGYKGDAYSDSLAEPGSCRSWSSPGKWTGDLRIEKSLFAKEP